MSDEANALKRALKTRDQQIRALEATVARLELNLRQLQQELKLEKANARKFRQIDENTEHPLRAATEEETLFNVCNHSKMNHYMSLDNPRVIGMTRYLRSPIQIDGESMSDVEIGESLSDTDLRKNLNAAGQALSKREFERVFPRNVALNRLINDVANGDRHVDLGYLECMVTSARFCMAENDNDIDLTARDNCPHIAPDGTTASLYAFESAARRRRDGNASLDQGDRAGANKFYMKDIVPNIALKKISEMFIETWAQPVTTQPRRAETFDSTVDYEERRAEGAAAREMNMQGFGTHTTQMCMIIDKQSFDPNNPQDKDNAGRVARRVAQLAIKLDDDHQLQLFSHEVGEATVINMKQPGNDIRIMQSMMKQEAPPADQHIMALLEHFYPGDPQNAQYRSKPVFCTLLTKGLTPEKYILLKNSTALFRAMQLPFFLKVVNINPDISQEEIQRMSRLDDNASNNGVDGIDNVDVVHARQPDEITPKNFLREYAGFVVEAHSRNMLHGEQGFDMSKVNAHSEGRSGAR